MKNLLVLLVPFAFIVTLGVALLGPSAPAEAQVIYSNYCCDGAGVHRCVMVNGPFPIGTSCFCNGQGYGVVCP